MLYCRLPTFGTRALVMLNVGPICIRAEDWAGVGRQTKDFLNERYPICSPKASMLQHTLLFFYKLEEWIQTILR